VQQLGHLQRDGQPFTALLAVGMGFDAWAEIGGAQAQQAAAYGTQRQVGDGVGRPIGVRGGGEQGGTIERVARHAAFHSDSSSAAPRTRMTSTRDHTGSVKDGSDGSLTS
jgi:hypothetical protein